MPAPKSESEELARLRRHAENDIPEALKDLADVYRRGGLGLKVSLKKCAKLYKRAVELGSVEAMNNLGGMYEVGEGVKLDRKKAMQLYRLCADRGHAGAQQNLAIELSRMGSFGEAIRYFKLAAAQGLSVAEFSLGARLYNGEEMERDVEEAKRLFALAAAKGYERAVDAMARLGLT